MMLEEFEKRTGFYPTLVQYAAIERAYMEFDGDNEFGFERSKITILHEVDEYEINRHSQLRRTGKKIDRRPIYCATDYHYIRFNVGRGQWQWEAWNGQIRPFWD